MHLIYSKKRGNLGLVLNDKRCFLHKTIYCCDLLESPRGGDSNRWPKHKILLRIDGNYPKHLFESGLMQGLSRKTLSYVRFLGYGDIHVMMCADRIFTRVGSYRFIN